MNAEDLQQLTRAQPFEPFRLHLTDGQVYDVKHPDNLIATKRTALIAVRRDPADPVPDHVVTVAILHIDRHEPLSAPAVPENGQG